MKNLSGKAGLLLLPIFLITLSGCPVGLDYSAGEPGSEKYNKKLIGKWQFTPTDSAEEAEVVALTVTREDDKTLKVLVEERGTMYSLETDELTGYETQIDGLNILFFKPQGEDKFYHYQYTLQDENTLIVADIALLVGGVDAVTSIETLRHEIQQSRNKPGFYHEPRTYIRVK